MKRFIVEKQHLSKILLDGSDKIIVEGRIYLLLLNKVVKNYLTQT